MNGHSEGYKWIIDQNWGRMAKIGIFGQKPRFCAQKKESLLNGNHVLATTGKSCSKKKIGFFPNECQSLKKFWVIFWVKTLFWPKNHFSAKRKNVRFSVIPAQTGSIVILGHYFDGPDCSTKFP